MTRLALASRGLLAKSTSSSLKSPVGEAQPAASTSGSGRASSAPRGKTSVLAGAMAKSAAH
jgi:hypothetical protein